MKENDSCSQFKFRVITSIEEIEKDSWNTLVPKNFPFSQYEFLYSLEKSHCVGNQSGWTPYYILLHKSNKLVGALPLYLKTHSYGEYIFDWQWAQISHQNGIKYYPKLIAANAFSPVNGPKFLLKENKDDYRALLLKRAQKLQTELKAHSLHFLFTTKEEQHFLEEHDFISRTTYQFHWHNNQYSHFNDYLSHLKSNKRKIVIKDRAATNKYISHINSFNADEITSKHIKTLHGFYQKTIQEKHSHPYLNIDFFKNLQKYMNKNLILYFAFKESDEEPIASSFFLKGGNKLYGRYWGSSSNIKGLHFEMCYYQGIEQCIREKSLIFEAGAQGNHKLSRGFLPRQIYSSHQFNHDGLMQYVSEYCGAEKKQILESIKLELQNNPFKSMA